MRSAACSIVPALMCRWTSCSVSSATSHGNGLDDVAAKTIDHQPQSADAPATLPPAPNVPEEPHVKRSYALEGLIEDAPTVMRINRH
jgi:hypothetical protein